MGKRILDGLCAIIFVLNVVLISEAAILGFQGGHLVGHFDVNFDGKLLVDVEFFDGFCSDLFAGCDDLSDLRFKTV